jgi:hypothetical protein
MSDQPTQPSPERKPGVSVESGGDVNVGGDVAGRDIIRQSTTNVGFDSKTVQRLLVTVGAMVFVTALCFFSAGLVLGAGVFTALNTQVGSSPDKAASMSAKIEQLRALPAGQDFEIKFSEDEISSYVKFQLSETLGFKPETGRVRFLEAPGHLVVAGQAEALSDLPVLATLEWQGDTLKITNASVQLFDTGTPFGWVLVPGAFLQSLNDSLNTLVLDNAAIRNIREVTVSPDNREWIVEGTTR